MSGRYFVTGTDTDAGKTIVATTLAVGLKARYWKPLQTGSVEGTDSMFVSRWIGSENVFLESYCLPDPTSPHLAAENSGIKINLLKCITDFERMEGPVIVEGAGGVLVPINDSMTLIDLMKRLGLPVVIAARMQLGAINHTLLTIEALYARRVDVLGIVTVGDKYPGFDETIGRFTQAKILGNLPMCKEFSESWFRKSFADLALF